MPHFEDHDSNIDLPASPFTVITIDRARGVVRTYQGPMSFDEVAALLVEKIRGFDWATWTARTPIDKQPLTQSFETMLDVLSLMSEIEMQQARTLWAQNAPGDAGVPRMLLDIHDAQELRYLSNLAAQRELDDDALASHILDEGEFMVVWAEARREFLTTNDTFKV